MEFFMEHITEFWNSQHSQNSIFIFRKCLWARSDNCGQANWDLLLVYFQHCYFQNNQSLTLNILLFFKNKYWKAKKKNLLCIAYKTELKLFTFFLKVIGFLSTYSISTNSVFFFIQCNYFCSFCLPKYVSHNYFFPQHSYHCGIIILAYSIVPVLWR